MHKVLTVLMFVILSPMAAAQTPVRLRLTAGPSLINASGNDGSGFHLTATVPITTTSYGVRWSAVAFAMNGSTDGSPFQCRLVNSVYCFGRSEQLNAGSVALGGERGFRLFRVRAYALSQIGLYAEHVRAHELEGPTTLCVVGGSIISCPDNPPFQDHASVGTTLGAGYAIGLGAEHSVSRVQLSLELTAHQYRTPSRNITMLWAGAGVGF